MLSDESGELGDPLVGRGGGPSSRVDHRTRVIGSESSAVSLSERMVRAESGRPEPLPADGEGEEGEAGPDPRVQVRWEETASAIDVVVAFDAGLARAWSTCGGGQSGGGQSGGDSSAASDRRLLRKAELEVVIRPRHVSLRQVGAASGPTRLLAAGELAAAVDTDGSFWWVDDAPAQDAAAELSGGGFGGGGVGGAVMPNEPRLPDAKRRALPDVLRLSLRKRTPGIWAGVWAAELAAAKAAASDPSSAPPGLYEN
jgi:hypothetical protein